MTLGGKIIALASTIGVVSGGVALTNNFLSPNKSIKERLTEEGFDVNVTSWTNILTAYNALKDTTKTFKATNDEQEIEAKLIQKCQSVLSKDTNNIDDYKKARQWCVKEETADAILKKAKYTILNATSVANEEETQWEQKTKELKENATSFPNVGDKMTGTKTTDIAALKAGCTELAIASLKTTATDFNEKFELAKKWCSVKQNNV